MEATQLKAPQPKAYAVPSLFWESLEGALMAKSRELVRDIAKTLHQDEKKLMTALREQKKKGLYLIEKEDPTHDRFQCEALLSTTTVAHRCRKPVLYGEKYCPAHCTYVAPEGITTKPQLRHMKDEDGETYYLDPMTGQVYNIQYERIGSKKDETLIIFELE